MTRFRSFGSVGIAAAMGCGLLLAAAPATAWRDRTPPTTPSNLRITAATDTSVSLAWNPSTDNSSSFWYCVQRGGEGCIRVDPPRTTISFTKLLPDRTHTFSVYAVDAAGNRSGNSNTVSHTTPPDVTPPTPQPNLTVTELFPTRVTVSWPAPVDNVSPQVWFTLFVDGSPAGYVDQLGPPTATVAGLNPGQAYRLQVTIRDASGNVNAGQVLEVRTPTAQDDVAPTAPTNLRVTSQSMENEIWLTWTQSTDNMDAQADLRYNVYLNDQLEFGGQPGGRTIVTCVSEGFTRIFVTAVDTSGNESAPSNVDTFDCSL
jgi:chitodextrinase